LYTDGGHGHMYISVFGSRAMLANLKHDAGGHGVSFVVVQYAAVSGDGRVGASIGHQTNGFTDASADARELSGG
jgi:hypothetical protein